MSSSDLILIAAVVFYVCVTINRTRIRRSTHKTPLAQRKVDEFTKRGFVEIAGATVIVDEHGHAAIVNRGGRFYWVQDDALVFEYDLEKEEDEDHEP